MTCLSIGYISHDLSLNNAIFITWPVPALCFPTVYLFATLLTLWLIPYHSQCNRSLGILLSYLDLARQSSLSFKFTFKATGAKHGYITADLLIIKVDKGTETFKSMVASAQHTSLWQWDLPGSGRETEEKAENFISMLEKDLLCGGRGGGCPILTTEQRELVS